MAPIQWYLGILGLTGLRAYVGPYLFLQHGAVGSIACQMSKTKGCHVIGSAGSQEKVNWLLDQARIDYAFNYKEISETNISTEVFVSEWN